MAAKKRCRQIPVLSLFDWLDGHFVGASDEEVAWRGRAPGDDSLDV